jgi:hypothetical protein
MGGEDELYNSRKLGMGSGSRNDLVGSGGIS